MTVKELIEKLNLKIMAGEKGISNTISGAYTSDLLSDVMGNIDEGNLWITLQAHKNVVAVATLREASAVILVRSYQPDNDMLEKANDENLPILSTDLGAFEVSGKIYNIINS